MSCLKRGSLYPCLHPAVRHDGKIGICEHAFQFEIAATGAADRTLDLGRSRVEGSAQDNEPGCS